MMNSWFSSLPVWRGTLEPYETGGSGFFRFPASMSHKVQFREPDVTVSLQQCIQPRSLTLHHIQYSSQFLRWQIVNGELRRIVYCVDVDIAAPFIGEQAVFAQFVPVLAHKTECQAESR